ncbi:Trp biosynthesis-associated membrane protein [Microbacterium sp. zg.B48]|uniref:Trp biosynthesis-associated membrane protein n=1 Tax=unclassified Microbacterium TaxID=2609290 RepID=UPI00214BD76A|nr:MULTISPECIES: Trp biosynthesis-associated membrane protein [unclassified Microbacterium]MCR2762027.1 Trp biosynthesis-associated membrane protein [Microbacterium sp. zg.B48]MCR2809966.1 Trp biosynthesis-associated membrane protein [Microbacterium sp. zg.B185]WIM17730.1 Trp biosynthesis-associated membrane protein [Microbacterium sp. zg-B185]
MIRRARLLAVLTTLAVGAMGVISSTQTWLVATLDDGAQHTLAVAGAAAVPVLTPLSLAVLALGAALSIVGVVLRYVFGALTVAIAALLGWLSAQIAIHNPIAAVASTVTTATGITGEDAVAELVSSVTATPWPAVTLAGSIVLLAAGLFTLVSARFWGRSGHKYDADAGSSAAADPASRPFDAVDSWDDISRGADPTAGPTVGPR